MEPERPIEKLLRAFSKKRREQAGQFELHAATRNLLQGEILRELAPKSQGNKPGLLRFWRQFAYSFGLFAVLVSVAYFLFLSPNGAPIGDLAQAPAGQVEPSAVPSSGSSLSPAPGSALFDAKADAGSLAAATPMAEEKDRPPANSAPVPAATTFAAGSSLATVPLPASPAVPTELASARSSVDEPAKQADRTRDELLLSLKRQAAAPVPVKAEARLNSGAPAAVAQSELQDTSVTLAASYQRTPTTESKAKNSPTNLADASQPNPDVLNLFRMEQAGDAVKITDSDGSIYRGHIVATTDQSTRRSVTRNTISATDLRTRTFGLEPQSQPVSFSVSGTNVTSKQPVVFVGTFSPYPTTQFYGLVSNSVAKITNNSPAIQVPTAIPTTKVPPRISGKLTVGTKESPFEAAPTRP